MSNDHKAQDGSAQRTPDHITRLTNLSKGIDAAAIWEAAFTGRGSIRTDVAILLREREKMLADFRQILELVQVDGGRPIAIYQVAKAAIAKATGTTS